MLWREEVFGARAARLVLEVFERRRGQTARSVKHRSPRRQLSTFRPIRRHLKGQLAHHHPLGRVREHSRHHIWP